MKKNIILIFTLLFFTLLIKSQSRWVRQYLEELSASGHYMSTAYDHGYLITGRIVPGYQYTWLIKSDVNGEILWEKFIGGYYNSVSIDRFTQNEFGDIYLCGSITHEGNYDPLIIKLNPCGEKEWCRQFTTTSDNDFYMDIVNTPDGGCAALVYEAFTGNINRSGILKFSSNGDLLWQQYYQSPDQGVSNENLSNLLLTPDSGLLMTGYCYYPDPDNPTISWLHPYYVKVDLYGNFEWEFILHMETGDLGGKAWETLLNPNNNYYYSCISHYYHSETLYAKRPAFVKIDLNGNVVGVYDLVNEDYNFGTLFSATFINDSLLAGGASWFYSDDQPQSRAIIFDTLGNIKDSLTLLNTGWLSKTAVTYDGKLLFYNTIEEEDGFDTYLFKLTQDLEQDTFYMTPFVYDSLCPYQIASDTIVPDDCGVIVGVEEEEEKWGQGEEGKRGELEVWPNPASGEIHVRLNMDDGRFYSDLTLVIYNIFGREVTTMLSPSPKFGEGRGVGLQWQFNVENYPPGIYLAVLRDGQCVIATAKFVVAR